MDKSSASSQSQKPSPKLRVQKVPSIPRSEAMTRPTSQAIVLPAGGASQPTETSVGKVYLKIIEDAMGKFSPAGKMSEVFAQIAKKFKDEEEQPSPIPIRIPIVAAIQTEPEAAQSLTALLTSQNPSTAIESAKITDNRKEEAEFKEEVEPVEEGNRQEGEGGGEECEEAEKPEKETVQETVEEKSAEKKLEVVDVEERGSTGDEETLDERATRRSLRTQRKIGTEDPENLWKEAAALLAAKKEAAERKIKGKHIATSSTKRKPCQASKGIIIQESVTDLTRSPYYHA